MKSLLIICKFLTPPNLPKGEELSPFGGFRGSKCKITFKSLVNGFHKLLFGQPPATDN